MSKCCNNKIKKIAFILLTLTSLGIIAISVLIYLTGFLRINNKTFDGTSSIKNWNMDYSSFSVFISYACYAGLAVGLFGLIAAKFKRWKAASFFVFISIGGSGACMFASNLAMSYKVDNTDRICLTSNEG
jgi:ABC-type multidrug transport system fused ATPase/permease subunit